MYFDGDMLYEKYCTAVINYVGLAVGSGRLKPLRGSGEETC
jgi:hypothetical protein